MDRLTKRNELHGFLPVLLRGRALGPAYFREERDYQDYADALERLAQYEEAEESGRFVRLPFKVGDTAYMLWPCGKNGKGIAVLSVRHIDMDHTQNVVFSGIAQRGSGSYRQFTAGDVGKTVFITREEAAEALKKVNP